MLKLLTVSIIFWIYIHPSHELAFCPSEKDNIMWDTWIYKRGDTFLLNYLSNPRGGRWDSVSSALSTNGVHWADLGNVIRKDCVSTDDCAVWLGSGSVWPYIGAENETWLMNYSQEYDCDGDNCQSIFFATSTDLITWTPVAPDSKRLGGIVFKYNTQYYEVNGRWDCIAVLPRPGGGYYGYWTATPRGTNSLCGVGVSCGAGFGQSDDGLIWQALPTPGPAVSGEVGGVAQLGGVTFMTFDAGHLFQAPSPRGPFVPSRLNFNFLTSEGGSFFPRLWGSLYTQDPSLVLVTHQQVVDDLVYVALIKRAALGPDGVLRAVWWSANNALKGEELPFIGMKGILATSCLGNCLLSGLWIEGTVLLDSETDAGLWLETEEGGFSFGVLTVPGNNTVFFQIGEMPAPPLWSNSTFLIDHSVSFSLGHLAKWKAIVRTAGNNLSMVEFYVDDILTLPFTLPSPVTGVFTGFGGAVANAAFRLTLPQGP